MPWTAAKHSTRDKDVLFVDRIWHASFGTRARCLYRVANHLSVHVQITRSRCIVSYYLFFCHFGCICLAHGLRVVGPERLLGRELPCLTLAYWVVAWARSVDGTG